MRSVGNITGGLEYRATGYSLFMECIEKRHGQCLTKYSYQMTVNNRYYPKAWETYAHPKTYAYKLAPILVIINNP